MPAETTPSPAEQQELAQSLTDRAQKLLTELQEYSTIDGCSRLLRQIRTEMDHYSKFVGNQHPSSIRTNTTTVHRGNNNWGISNLNEGNLVYYESIVRLMTLFIQNGHSISSVFKEIRYSHSHGPNIGNTAKMERRQVRVDLIVDDVIWVRVRASKKSAAAMSECSSDASSSDESDSESEDETDLSDEDDDGVDSEDEEKWLMSVPWRDLPQMYRLCVSLSQATVQHRIHYTKPMVVFWFTHIEQVSPRMERMLQRLGCGLRFGFDVANLNETIQASQPQVDMSHSSSNVASVDDLSVAASTENLSMLSPILNLDVSTLLALTSEISHMDPASTPPEHVNHIPALAAQFKEEAGQRLLPVLKQVLMGVNVQRVIVCESAHKCFMNIMTTLGCGRELERARALFEKGEGKGLMTMFQMLPEDPVMERAIEIVPDRLSERYAKLKHLLNALNVGTPQMDKIYRAALPLLSNHYRSEVLYHLKFPNGSQSPAAKLDARFINRLKSAVPKLTDAHMAILGTSDVYNATLLTANKWMLKSLKHMDDSLMFRTDLSTCAWEEADPSMETRLEKMDFSETDESRASMTSRNAGTAGGGFKNMSMWIHPSRSLVYRNPKDGSSAKGKHKFVL